MRIAANYGILMLVRAPPAGAVRRGGEKEEESMPIPEKGNDLCRVSAKDIIYRTVCEWIITGVLRPGEKILDSELAKHFNVSRTPVREALQILESQKLICVLPGRATVVAELDVDDIEKCYRPLAEIQGLAAELACARLTEEVLDALEGAYAGFAAACDADDAREAIAWDNRFHEIIVHASGNEYVGDFSRLMILHIQRIKYHYFHSDQMRKASASEHNEILQAMRARDSALAKQATRSHWLRAMEDSLQGTMAKLRAAEARENG